MALREPLVSIHEVSEATKCLDDVFRADSKIATPEKSECKPKRTVTPPSLLVKKKKERWLHEEMAVAIRKKDSMLRSYLYLRRRVWLARLCFAVASATLFTSQTLIHVSEANQSKDSQASYEGAVLMGSALGSVYVGCIFDMEGWFRATIVASAFLGIGSALNFFVFLFFNYVTWLSNLWNGIYDALLFITGLATGFGIGGFYPIAATLNTSLKRSVDQETSLELSLSKTFVMQWVGRMIALVSSTIILNIIMRGADVASTEQKVIHDALLGLLILFALAWVVSMVYAVRKEYESEEIMFGREIEGSLTIHNIFGSLYQRRRALVVAAICWFLFDMIYYSNGGDRSVLLEAFEAESGDDENAFRTNRDQLYLLMIAFVGYSLGIAVMRWTKINKRSAQVAGFFALCFGYVLAIPVASAELSLTTEYVTLVAFAAIRYVAQQVPNVTTFVLAATTASPETPGSFFGAAAGFAKLGAAIGYFFTEFAMPIYGDLDTDQRITLYVVGTVLCIFAMFSTMKIHGPRYDFASASGSRVSSTRLITVHDLDLALDGPKFKEFAIPAEDVRIVEHLKSGAYGKVYRGRYGDEDVAVKLLWSSEWARRGDTEWMHEFAKEASILWKLRHPLVNRLYGVIAMESLPGVTSRSTLCMVSEFCVGGSIDDVLRAERRRRTDSSSSSSSGTSAPPPAMLSKSKSEGADSPRVEETKCLTILHAVKWARQICEVMTFLHRRRIVHLDLKPDNVLLTSQNLNKADIKLIDLGCAKTLPSWDNKISTDTIQGAPAYRAPEMLHATSSSSMHVRDDNGAMAPKIDVYAAGILFGEMFSGEVPFKSVKDAFQIYDIVLRGGRPALDAVPAWLARRVVRHMTCPLPAQRAKFGILRDRLHAYEEALREFFRDRTLVGVQFDRALRARNEAVARIANAKLSRKARRMPSQTTTWKHISVRIGGLEEEEEEE